MPNWPDIGAGQSGQSDKITSGDMWPWMTADSGKLWKLRPVAKTPAKKNFKLKNEKLAWSPASSIFIPRCNESGLF